MGTQTQQSAPTQAPIKDAGEAYDLIAPYVRAQFAFRKSGIDYACNHLNMPDAPSLGSQLLKSGLKIGIAAAAGAVAATTGGLGVVAMGAIGGAFGALGGEIVDSVFAAQSAPQGVEEFRMERTNVLTEMEARETEMLVGGLAKTDATGWAQALADYKKMEKNKALQAIEIDSTLDGWMNAVNEKANGSSGALKQGDQELDSATTGRLHIAGTVTASNSGPSISLSSATINGLDKAELRNRYLDRKIADIGMFCQFAIHMGIHHGALGFRSGAANPVIEDDCGDFKANLGRLSVSGPAITSPNYDWSTKANEGAKKVVAALNGKKLKDFGLTTIDDGGMFE